MRGHRALPLTYSDAAAEQVRVAEVVLRSGQPSEALHILEATLEVCAADTPELPGWLCSRLAALYRTVGRHDDEVRLLERYRDTQSNEEARTRFDARLSKARAIAERKRRHDTRALSSVREVISSHAQVPMPRPVQAPPDHALSPVARDAVRRALLALANSHDLAVASEALRAVCLEAREKALPAERVVIELRSIWRGTTPPALVGVLEWDAAYRVLLTTALATYFEDPS